MTFLSIFKLFEAQASLLALRLANVSEELHAMFRRVRYSLGTPKRSSHTN
jgi:hypothetical protein